MSRVRKSEQRAQPPARGGQVDQDVVDVDGAAADAAREAREHEVIGEFLTASCRLGEDLNRRTEEACRLVGEFYYHPGIDEEIAELKQSNRSILKLVRLLENLKKLQNERIKDLKWILGLFRSDDQDDRG